MKRNLIVSLASSIWIALVGLAVVPFYLRYLGVEAYGLIGFFVMIQALLQLLDLGLAPTINREVACCSAADNMHEARNLLHTLAVVYWVMAAVIALTVAMLATFVAEYWLQSRQLSQDTVKHAVMLMGLVVACRWPSGLYQGALMGMQRQVVSGTVNMIMLPIGSIGAVVVLAFVSPTIEAFFIWQACAALLYVIVMRWSAWKVIGREGAGRFNVERLKLIWRFSMGMSAVAITSIAFTQLDKVILSKTIGLAEFGHYMLATTVVGGLYLLITPVFNVVYPRFSALVKSGDTEKLIKLYRLGTCLFAYVFFPVAMLLAVFAKDVMLVWTGNSDIAANVAPIITLLTIGSALHGVMSFPYALQLAYGMTRLPLVINAILMAIMVPLVVFLSLSYGAIGGALAWTVLHTLYVMLGTWLTHRHLLIGIGAKWLFQDVGIPLIISILLGFLGCYALQDASCSVYERLMYGGALGLVGIAFPFVLSSQLRALLLNRVGWENHSKTA